MHGNVRQWCADWYGPYDVADRIDPHGVKISRAREARVLRGGSWYAEAWYCRSAHRFGSVGHAAGYTVGCRVCFSPE
jgi:formylglycine-generating enzyme required for sulfatase activity